MSCISGCDNLAPQMADANVNNFNVVTHEQLSKNFMQSSYELHMKEDGTTLMLLEHQNQ